MLSEQLHKHEFCPRGVYEIICTFQKTPCLHYKNETFNDALGCNYYIF